MYSCTYFSSNIQIFLLFQSLRGIFKEFFLCLFLCKNQLKPPHCSPILFYSRGSIKTNLNLNYIGMLPRKFQLFQPIKVVFEKMFYIPMTLCKNISASYTHTHTSTCKFKFINCLHARKCHHNSIFSFWLCRIE